MNSFFETNDFRNYQNSLRPELLRFSSFGTNANFGSNLIESNLNCNDGYHQNFQHQVPKTSSPIPYKNHLNKPQDQNDYDQIPGAPITNDNNLIGLYNPVDNSNMIVNQKNVQISNSNMSDSYNSYNNNNNNSDLNSYFNNVSLQFQTDQSNNESLIKLNLFQQFANDSNFKQFSNLNFFSNNNHIIENKPYQYNILENHDLKVNTSNQISQINPISTNVVEQNSTNNNNNNMMLMMAEQKPKKVKKSRILFSQWQINELEKLFKKQKYVTSNERELMAKRLKLQANQVKIWFQNRRYKIKKQSESQKE